MFDVKFCRQTVFTVSGCAGDTLSVRHIRPIARETLDHVLRNLCSKYHTKTEPSFYEAAHCF